MRAGDDWIGSFTPARRLTVPQEPKPSRTKYPIKNVEASPLGQTITSHLFIATFSCRLPMPTSAAAKLMFVEGVGGARGSQYGEVPVASPMTPGMWPSDLKTGDVPVLEKQNRPRLPPLERFGPHGEAGKERRRWRDALELTPSEIAWAWLPEICSSGFGILLFLSIIVILRVFDGEKQPDLILELTINSLLQYLISLTKLFLFVPVIEALGQLKWLWFASQPRSLLDFQLYDEATRGGIGAFKLLFRLKGLLKSYVVSPITSSTQTNTLRPLLWLASILLISAIFTSAVTQQLVSIQSSLLPSPSLLATAPLVSTFSRWNGAALQLGQPLPSLPPFSPLTTPTRQTRPTNSPSSKKSSKPPTCPLSSLSPLSLRPVLLPTASTLPSTPSPSAPQPLQSRTLPPQPHSSPPSPTPPSPMSLLAPASATSPAPTWPVFPSCLPLRDTCPPTSLPPRCSTSCSSTPPRQSSQPSSALTTCGSLRWR